MGRDVWLFYVDDSTNDQHDLLAAVAVPVGEWSVNLGGWLDHRKMLAEQHGLPSGYEFHASKFLGVRGNPHEDVHQPINWDKALRRTIYEQCLDAIVALPSVEVLAVHQRGRQQRLVLYRSLLDHLSVWLEERDALGIVVMDGEDVSYRGVHRQLRLADRRIIEDAWLQGARESQFVQAADLVVHAALQHVTRADNRSFMWNWFPDRFGPIISG